MSGHVNLLREMPFMTALLTWHRFPAEISRSVPEKDIIWHMLLQNQFSATYAPRYWMHRCASHPWCHGHWYTPIQSQMLLNSVLEKKKVLFSSQQQNVEFVSGFLIVEGYGEGLLRSNGIYSAVSWVYCPLWMCVIPNLICYHHNSRVVLWGRSPSWVIHTRELVHVIPGRHKSENTTYTSSSEDPMRQHVLQLITWLQACGANADASGNYLS